jgi:hypothetical protein
VNGPVVVDERHPAVVRLHVLRDAAVGDDDQVADRIVGATLGRVDRAVDLHVRRHRVERALGCRDNRQAEAIPDKKRLRSLRLLGLLCGHETGTGRHGERGCTERQSKYLHVALSSKSVSLVLG